MGIVSGLLLGGAALLGLHAIISGVREDKRRRETPCHFNDGISKEQFQTIVSESAKHIKRLKTFYVEYTIVHGTAVSQSGLSEWNFTIDFNDYGHITGRYWISSDNSDSTLPKVLAERIKERIVVISNQ